VAASANKWDGRTLHPTTHTAMPVFKRTRSKVDETDSEPGGTPTIGKRSNKRNKALGNAPAADRELRGSPQKLAVYIVAVKLGPDRTVAGLSKLVKESADYALAKNAEEADVVVTGIGMRQRLERSISTELIVSCDRPSHILWDANRDPRTGSPSSNRSGWKSRSETVNDNRTTNTELSTSGKARCQTMRKFRTTVVTTRSMKRKSSPALRPTSVLMQNLPANVNHLSFARTKNLSSRSTLSGVPGNLI